MTNALQPPPLSTPFFEQVPVSGTNAQRVQRISQAWQLWLTAIQLNLQSGVSNTTGLGNGADANVQAPAVGTGSGPANPNLVKGWLELTVNGAIWYTPLFQ